MAWRKGTDFGGYFEAGTNFRIAAQINPALFGPKFLAIHAELQCQEKEFAILSLKELRIAAGSRFMGQLLRAVGVIDNAVNRGFQNSWSRQALWRAPSGLKLNCKRETLARALKLVSADQAEEHPEQRSETKQQSACREGFLRHRRPGRLVADGRCLGGRGNGTIFFGLRHSQPGRPVKRLDGVITWHPDWF
jgi:hypothetical protein